MAQPVPRSGVLLQEPPACCHSVQLASSSRIGARTPSPVQMISTVLFYSMASGTFPLKLKSSWLLPRLDSDGSAGRIPRSSIREGGSGQKGANFATEARSPADSGSGSYLSMWKRARERQEQERLKKEAEKEVFSEDDIRRAAQLRREKQFESILQVPAEERDRVERMQVVDRAAAALAAAQALLADLPPIPSPNPDPAFSSVASAPSSPLAVSSSNWLPVSSVEVRGSPFQQLGQSAKSGSSASTSPTLGSMATPGPDFWAWAPPPPSESSSPRPRNAHAYPPSKSMPSVIEKDRTFDTLPLRFESNSDDEGEPPFTSSSRIMPSLPPLQSLMEISKQKKGEVQSEGDIRVPGIELEKAALHATERLKSQDAKSVGVNPDGARWWKETGIDRRENGVVCRWTVIRGVTEDGSVEWEEKFWEAYDQYDYKELGAEKSGRDSRGGVWRESWKESMWQDALNGLLHMEKSADKWAKNGQGGQWHEKWWEHYDASGKAEKWADKWSQIDPSTPLEPGHAHVWHERWGENYDGQGSCTKYTDKWAERAEYGGGWTKWGDKWDERFDRHEHGVKQGETWWEGQNGERWNRTWGEGHNGSGWVHKYGKSSSGEHWDTHEEQDTWYEKKPHYGFKECYDCSRELRKVGKNDKDNSEVKK